MPWISINQWKKKHGIGKPKKVKTKAKAKKKEVFKLVGYDTFSNEWYSLKNYPSEEAAKQAARERLGELERTQPSASSGGQSGIQDQVYIERPDGSNYRVFRGV